MRHSDENLKSGRHARAKHGLDVDVVFEGDGPPLDEPTRLLLFRTARELLFNVVKHSRVSRAEVGVAFSPDRLVRLRVLDHGVGFDPDAKVADRNSGLSGIRQRLRAIGGSLEVRSAPGAGVEVNATVPTTTGAATPLSPAAASAEEPASGEEPRRRVRVLLVDDHPLVREGLVALLQEEPNIFICGEVANGTEAVEETRRLRPAVIVMDVNLPGMDGVEATRRIVEEFPEVRVIGLSLDEGDFKADAMRKAGAVDYVVKSAPIGVLVKTIYEVANVTHAARPA